MRSLKKSVQQVLRKKVDVKNATPDVAETPPNQVRPSVCCGMDFPRAHWIPQAATMLID